MPKTKKTTKAHNNKPKSIGPKFCAILLICLLAIFALVGNLHLLKTVRDELRISFDYELNTAVEVLASNINTVYDRDPSNSGRDLAAQMIQNATWNNGRRVFWATDSDDPSHIITEQDLSFGNTSQKTKFGFTIVAGYDQAYFDTYAYPKTEEFIRLSTVVILLVALFALGSCTIAFHRSHN